jgi:uncharacterized LabA/DUF88 family protein
VYVDGFNFYYAAFDSARGALPQAYKWLDLRRLCELALPANRATAIRYFAAKISATNSDPGKPARQESYLAALRTVPGLSIHLGHVVVNQKYLKAVAPAPGEAKRPLVYVPEEKGSDVNLASYLVLDACREELDVAVIVSNDSDLEEPVRIVREALGKTVGVLRVDAEPRRCVFAGQVDFIKPLRRAHFSGSQFPDAIVDSTGATIRRPSEWV